MSPTSRVSFATAVGTACLAGFQPSAHAGLIDYSYSGTVTAAIYRELCLSPPCPPVVDRLAGAVNNPFSASLRIDTSNGSIVSFSYSVTGLSAWTGTGGALTRSSTSFLIDLQESTGFSSYSSRPINGDANNFHLLDLVGPASAFSNFVDGYATSFNLAAMTTRGGQAAYCGLQSASITVNLTAVSGTAVQTPTSTVAEPGTVALAGLAGLAALRSVRRRKAAAA